MEAALRNRVRLALGARPISPMSDDWQRLILELNAEVSRLELAREIYRGDWTWRVLSQPEGWEPAVLEIECWRGVQVRLRMAIDQPYCGLPGWPELAMLIEQMDAKFTRYLLHELRKAA